MGLPIKLPFPKKKERSNFYLALILRDDRISAVIFEEQKGNIAVTSTRNTLLRSDLESLPDEELVSIIDATVSQAEETLPADVEITNTVFGVKHNWVEEKKIKKDYLAKLKYICSELSLSPIGFIVITEAIVHLVKQEEGIPVTALLTEIGKDEVRISLFKAGKLIETKKKPIQSTPMHAVDDALKEIEHVEILPSRIILLHEQADSTGEKKDDITQAFISHQWSKSLPFLQIPQISLLPAGFDGKAIVSGAATQLGFTFTAVPHDPAHTDITNIEAKQRHHTQHTKTASPEDETDEEAPKETPELSEPEEKHAEITDKDSEETFGFVMEKDIATIPQRKHETTPIDSAEEPVKDESAEEKPHTSGHHETVTHHKEDMDTETIDAENEEDAEVSLPPKQPLKKKKSFSAGITAGIRNLRRILRFPPVPARGFLIVPPLLLIFLIGLALLYFFQLKATVILHVSPKSVNETERITLSTKSANDFSQNIIAAKEIEVQLDGSSESSATGEKEVGDKAKGTITMYNSDEAKKTFKEGTSVTSEKGLVYFTDKEVSVASASGDIFTGIKSGTAQVPVTAKQIGTEYNLPSNSKFSLEGTNTVAAKNESAFSGGTKKKVTVVSKKDIEKLQADLPKSLEQKAKDALKAKLSPDEELLSGFTKVTLTKENVDKKEGEETKTVKLTGAVSFTSVAYSRNDLMSFAENAIKQRYAQEELSKSNIDTKLSGVKDTSESEMTGVAAINAGLLPKIDIETIRNEITGKSFSDAKTYIQSVSPQIRDVEIRLSPGLPFIPQLLPRINNNIAVEVESSL